MGLFSATDKMTINVTGMTCGHCEMRVKEALEAIPGVKKAEVDRENDSAVCTVISKNRPDADLLTKAVDEAGYQASVAL